MGVGFGPPKSNGNGGNGGKGKVPPRFDTLKAIDILWKRLVTRLGDRMVRAEAVGPEWQKAIDLYTFKEARDAKLLQCEYCDVDVTRFPTVFWAVIAGEYPIPPCHGKPDLILVKGVRLCFKCGNMFLQEDRGRGDMSETLFRAPFIQVLARVAANEYEGDWAYRMWGVGRSNKDWKLGG